MDVRGQELLIYWDSTKLQDGYLTLLVRSHSLADSSAYIGKSSTSKQGRLSTMVSHDIYQTASLRDADCMVLHAWAATNVSEHEDLNSWFGLLVSGIIRCT